MAETVISQFFVMADRKGTATLFEFNHAGTWVPIGWRQAARLAKDFAAGLLELGHLPGDRLSILANTRHEWLCADLGNLAVGGVTVGVYPTMTGEQSSYIIGHSDSRFLVVEDAKQLGKVTPYLHELPELRVVIVIDPTGLTLGGNGSGPRKMSLGDVIALGQTTRRDRDVEARLAAIKLEDQAIFVYTSGTTGPPKGAILTHGNVVAALHAFSAVPTLPSDTGFTFLPLGHVLQRICSYRNLWEGTPGAFARGLDTVAEDIASARPSVVASVPRIFEKIYAKIHDQAAAGSPAKQKIFAWAVKTGKAARALAREGKPVPPALAAQARLADKLVFSKLRDKLGGRIRIFVTGGAPISRDILEFFDAANICILEGWGMTETCAAGTANLPDQMKFGSIGRPVPGVVMKLDTDGEILLRGPNLFSGYYKDPAATKEAFTDDGFLRTGDIGKVDADGFYYIIDRKKDLIITAAGKNIAPQNIENHLKTDSRLSQVVVIGDRRNYLVALIAVTPEARAGKSENELAALVEGVLAEKNKDLASYERVKKFKLLPGELTIEAGEITPTLKVKRKVVSEKYAKLIDELYADKKEDRAMA
jgi:long-chain acyl-CoA synthetase